MVINSTNIVVGLSVLFSGLLVLHPRLTATPTWRATVTPLASIIGSGFLVLAPILLRIFGYGAVFIMAGLCLTAYAIGGAIRWNIKTLDQITSARPLTRFEKGIEQVSFITLMFAYVISVCYYLSLLGAFFVTLTPYNDAYHGRMVTTAVLLIIGIIGWSRGLRGLEKAEQLSVGIKLAVIAGLLMGMGYHTVGLVRQGTLFHNQPNLDMHSIRIAFGLLITVQGFETSRYLKEEYDAKTRSQTMRYAQWISTVIYILFIGLAGVNFAAESVGLKETAVIGMMGQIAPILPGLLVLAALTAQFSAAVADTNGCGGLAQEMSRGRLPSKKAYALIVLAAAALTWSADIYNIISYASRAFAVFYGLQCLLAFFFCRRTDGSKLKALGFAALTLFCTLIALTGISAE